jgi:hypothetical protein
LYTKQTLLLVTAFTDPVRNRWGNVLLGLCAVGGFIKYGSLLLDAPFEHNPVLALAMVFTPPTTYALYLLWRQQQE